MRKLDDNYEVFISYRRKTGSQIARTLFFALKSYGINSFFDFTSIRNGKFNKAIYEAIDKVDCFILLLTPEALDACVNDENDWVRKEVEYAIDNNKIIIPVAPSDVKISTILPPVLPQKMEEALRTLQISRLDMEDLFIESLFKIFYDRFPACFFKKHGDLSNMLSVERFVLDNNENDEMSSKEQLFNAIEVMKISVFDYLVKDFMTCLDKDGIIKLDRQVKAFEELSKLLRSSAFYLQPEEYSTILNFCKKYLGGTYNDFLDYIRKLKARNENTTTHVLLKFVASRMDDSYWNDYKIVKRILLGDNLE